MNSQQLTQLLMQIFITLSGRTDGWTATDESPTADLATNAGITKGIMHRRSLNIRGGLM